MVVVMADNGEQSALSAQAKENREHSERRQALLLRLHRGEMTIDEYREASKAHQIDASAPEALVHRRILLGLARDLLDGRLSLDDFTERFVDQYIRRVPPYVFSDHESLFFDEVSDRAQWTVEAPTEEERQAGWLDAKEFKDWLAEYLRQSQAGRTV